MQGTLLPARKSRIFITHAHAFKTMQFNPGKVEFLLRMRTHSTQCSSIQILIPAYKYQPHVLLACMYCACAILDYVRPAGAGTALTRTVLRTYVHGTQYGIQGGPQRDLYRIAYVRCVPGVPMYCVTCTRVRALGCSTDRPAILSL